jgi:hypothetical protein
MDVRLLYLIRPEAHQSIASMTAESGFVFYDMKICTQKKGKPENVTYLVTYL